jgi:hypothetical protein
MNEDKETKILLRSMEELNKTIEQSLAKETGLANKAQKFNSFNTPLLRSVLFGILGLGIGVGTAILIGQFASVNVLLLSSSLSILFSTLGVVMSLYQSKGGNSAVKYDIALQEIEDEINRQKNEIEKLNKMGAPKDLITKRWNYLEELELQRIAIVSAKSKIYYKRLFKSDTKDFENQVDKVKKEQNQLALEAPKEEILELKQEVLELKKELELRKENSSEH